MMLSTEATIPDAPVPVAVEVRFAETDQMGVVHHSSYIVWFELGRVAWMKAAAMPYAEVAAGGHHFAVTAIHAAYRASCRFGDTVQVVTRLTKLRSRQVEFSYEVYNAATQTLLATGSSEHICVDLAGKMTKIPVAVQSRLLAGAERVAVATEALSV
ncbi:MAG: acyl-CoA thioesterase [Caldilineaceae bacterium]|nr:acyl-CoA thioesterase [Caldilineaceae bacterium]